MDRRVRRIVPITGIVLGLTLWLLPLHARAVTVLNSSFETPSEGSSGYAYQPSGADWTFNTQAGIAGSGSPWFSGSPPDGTQAAFIQTNATSQGTISQSLSGFTAGQSYSVAFWIAGRPGYIANPVTVSLGGISLGTYTPGSTAFTQVTTTAIVAGAADLTLLFAGVGSGDDLDSAIDLVSVNPALVPEPSSIALVVAGALGLCVARRRTI